MNGRATQMSREQPIRSSSPCAKTSGLCLVYLRHRECTDQIDAVLGYASVHLAATTFIQRFEEPDPTDDLKSFSLANLFGDPYDRLCSLG
jgi:hypothetical protein